METTTIKVIQTTNSGLGKVDFNNLEFGKYISDHMLVADYNNGSWHAPEVQPFGNLSVSPAALALHYGQAIFEGMKAFKLKNGSINLFRPTKHYSRLKKSCERMCMPIMEEAVFIKGLEALLKTDSNWIPESDGAALYIRPVMFASEEKFGVKVADEYKYVVFTGPVGPAFSKPVKLKVELEYSRAAKGGTGFTKCAGNYGGAFFPTQKAREEGFDQVIWTDSSTHSLVEESGMMNVMFVINGVLTTPPLSDSILDGITRDTLLTLAKGMGFKVEERPVSVKELEEKLADNAITEAFGAGTAAVVSPIAAINIKGKEYQLNYSADTIMNRLKKQLALIRTGEAEDIYHWNHIF